jgi:hypothetical protein
MLHFNIKKKDKYNRFVLLFFLIHFMYPTTFLGSKITFKVESFIMRPSKTIGNLTD